jgi:hypothetical protein
MPCAPAAACSVESCCPIARQRLCERYLDRESAPIVVIAISLALRALSRSRVGADRRSRDFARSASIISIATWRHPVPSRFRSPPPASRHRASPDSRGRAVSRPGSVAAGQRRGRAASASGGSAAGVHCAERRRPGVPPRRSQRRSQVSSDMTCFFRRVRRACARRRVRHRRARAERRRHGGALEPGYTRVA